MRGAFQARSAHHVQGRSVLLVDDILTTGARYFAELVRISLPQ